MGFACSEAKGTLIAMRIRVDQKTCAALFLVHLMSAAGCSGAQSTENPTPAPTPSESQKPSPPPPPASAAKSEITPTPAKAPPGMLSRADAEKYVLGAVNRDRKAHGLNPVVWNAIAAKSGQRQADDMAKHGYTAHFGTDGSYPEQRHTEAGGVAMVTENVACFADGMDRELDPEPWFAIDELDRIERTFMDEKPPMDGHRRNILTVQHNAVGIGLAKTKELHIVCMAQEFIDDYGQYEPIAQKASVGGQIRVAGELKAPAQIAAVGLSRVEKPGARTAADLNKTYAYAMPQPYVTYFPKGFKTPIPLSVNGNSFWIEVPLSDHKRPGLYSVSVWAKLPHTQDLLMVSLRTVHVN